MRNLARALVFLLALTPATAQTPQPVYIPVPLPAQSAIGNNLNVSGPAVAVPYSQLLANSSLPAMAGRTVKGNPNATSASPSDVAPSTARSSSLLNIDAFTGIGNTNYQILTTDRTVGTNAAFTGSRTWTLPAAAAVNPGQEIIVADFQGTVTVSSTLVVQRNGSDTVNGGTTITMTAANGAYLFRSDGISHWSAQALGPAASSATTVTCNGGLSGGTFNTSGTCALALNNATLQASPTNPTGTTSSAMMGLGGTCKLTPVYSTRIRLTFDGTGGLATAAAGNGATIQIKFGTGSAPSNGASVTGTSIGASVTAVTAASVPQAPFSRTVIITGLTTGTAYWFDLAVTISGSGTAQVQNVDCAAEEF